ncbi:unnamed protein product [Discosporangium mesarthrocarpum]
MMACSPRTTLPAPAAAAVATPAASQPPLLPLRGFQHNHRRLPPQRVSASSPLAENPRARRHRKRNHPSTPNSATSPTGTGTGTGPTPVEVELDSVFGSEGGNGSDNNDKESF